LYDENVRVFDMWQQWQYNGIGEWREMVNQWFTALGTDRDLVTFDEIKAFEEGEIAIITAIIKFTAINETGEALRFLQNRLSWVARKVDNNWKLVHQHTSSPIDFASMKAVLQKP
ncbi:MAG: nuclear transport factor 2 family protein, partial [Chitinophagaceae bacterium]|nr:nuclear transport factor 2 family protein [Chitinophagaceae bacterium]